MRRAPNTLSRRLDQRSRVNRLAIVSHPAVLPVNQLAYAELARRGWDVRLLVPSRWRNDYRPVAFPPQALPELASGMTPLPVILAGRQRRHLYLADPLARLRRIRPDVAFFEVEPVSLAAAQWAPAAARLRIPFGVQQAENLERELPTAIRALRSKVLGAAAFVAARSPRAAELARTWGARGDVTVIPHHVPPWATSAGAHATFTVGYAGRLSPEKGLDTLVAAVRRLRAPVDLLVAGNGALRPWLERVELGGDRRLLLRTNLRHEQMASAYEQMDVLVLPSRTTPTWVEQFGRVLVEALWCGVPVIGSDSGEIPWVIGATGGGVTFREGDDAALAAAIAALRDDPRDRARMGDEGRRRVAEMFAVEAVATALEDALVRVRDAGAVAVRR
jgi:glycosyltransferase involved in cell wall biosynthesis